VAHPSGTLLARAPRNAAPVAPLAIVWQAPAISDRDNDWSDV
jgi:hypothetical protein